MTEKHTILQVFTQQNETTRKNGENPVTATVCNLTQLHENAPNLLAF
jgi:Zn-dependent oligopeptidase